jgi:putative ABC transport system permease protein
MHDLRLALRGLRASPVLSTAAVLSLALGIGANTAIFSVVDALLLRPLPVPSPQRLVTVSSGFALNHGFKAGAGMNYDMWTRMHERATMFDSGFAWAPARVDLSRGGETQPADALFASGGFFDTLGVPALVGRTFSNTDDVKGGGPDGPVVVISYQVWQRRFAGVADVIGRTLPIDGVSCTIVGVMPPEFFGVEVGQPFDVVVPLAIEPDVRGARASLHLPSALLLTAMFRLKPGQSIESATAALRTIQPDVLGLSGGSAPRNLPAFLKDPYVLVPAAAGTSDRSGLRRQYTRPLLTAGGVVVLVLLVACVNIANLLLIRGADRAHEMSVRLALGASRWRLARQLLIESVLVAGMGAAAGLAFAAWASRVVVSSLSTPDTRVALHLPLDWRVLTVTATLAICTALLFGTGPAFRASRAAPVLALKQGGRARSDRARSGSLVVVQVALSLVLLAAAGLFLSTFRRLATLPLGFDAGRVLVVDVDTARAHTDPGSRTGYYLQIVETIASLPGVAHAAASTITPFNQATRSPLFADMNRVHEHVVSPGFFATYAMTIRIGRDFDRTDASGSPRVALVSESYVAKFLQGRSALDSTLDSGACGPPRGPCAVVGVVADAVFGPLRSGPHPTIYLPLAQSADIGPPRRTTIVISVRPANVRPALLAATIADALTKMNGRISFSYRPLEQDVTTALTRERLLAALSGFFAGLALLLAALGLYGVTAYSAARRRTEIGIRMALGATPLRVIGLVVTRALALTATGIIAGVALSAWGSRFIATLLFGIQPQDPATTALAVFSLAIVATLASGIPAVRAALVNPARALRET